MGKDEKSREFSAETNSNRKENGFSVEMKSLQNMEAISFSEDTRGVLIEGNLGELKELGMFEGTVLVVEGNKGTLMIDLTQDDLEKIMHMKVKNSE